MPLVAPCATLIASLAWLIFWLAVSPPWLGLEGIVDRKTRRIDRRVVIRFPLEAWLDAWVNFCW